MNKFLITEPRVLVKRKLLFKIKILTFLECLLFPDNVQVINTEIIIDNCV